jgi:hypothetical protein
MRLLGRLLDLLDGVEVIAIVLVGTVFFATGPIYLIVVLARASHIPLAAGLAAVSLLCMSLTVRDALAKRWSVFSRAVFGAWLVAVMVAAVVIAGSA